MKISVNRIEPKPVFKVIGAMWNLKRDWGK